MNLKTVAARAEATTGKADPVTVVLAAEATAVEAAAVATEIVAVVVAEATAIVAVEVVDTGSAVLDVMTSGADRHEALATGGLLNLIVSLDSTRATRSLQRHQCL